MSLQELKKSLQQLLKDYDNDNIINDNDIIDFENLIIDFDNNNNTYYYDSFQEVLSIYCFDDVKDFLLKDCENVADLNNLISDVDDDAADNYKVDIYNSLSNVYKSDLIDWIDDYLIEKENL